ncbi:unnamed protein product, partial [Polarella glacialis]
EWGMMHHEGATGMAQPLRLASIEGSIHHRSGGTPMGQLRQTARQCAQQPEEFLSMEWKDLSFTVHGKPILRHVTGMLEPGRLTGVIGPSGSGKTTLLNVLSGRQNPHANHIELLGTISSFGRAVDPAVFRRNIAYVMQEDSLLPFETPRECLRFSAYLRLSTQVPNEQRLDFVERLLSTLQLHDCAGTIVGSALVKGLSGGERKRTSVGVELITNPKLFFLDEPVSGLDSYAAYSLIEVLKQLAAAGVPVLCTVHQPSSEIFAMFDDVIIFHAGEVVYHGPTQELAAYFQSLGYACPSNFNPADHVMFLLQQEMADRLRDIKYSWEQSPACQKLVKKVVTLQQHSDASTAPADADLLLQQMLRHAASDRPRFCRQLCVLTAREVRGTFRNTGILYARLGMSVFLSVLYSWLFAGSASNGDKLDSSSFNCVAAHFDTGACTAHFQAHFGTLVSLSILSMMGCAQPILLQFPAERSVFLREYAAHQYGVIPYFMSKTLVEMPIVFMSQLLSFLITYWIMGLHGEFLLLVAVAWLLGMASSSLALLVGCGVTSGQKALQLAPLTLVPQMLFSGLFLPVAKIPASLRWVQVLCPLKYAIDLMTIVEFSYIKDSIDSCERTASDVECRQSLPGDYLRQALIHNQSIEWDQWAVYLSLLGALLVGFRVVATTFLWRKGKYVF